MAVDKSAWADVRSAEDFAALRTSRPDSACHWWPDIGPTGDAGSLSFTHRAAHLGPITVLDIDFHDNVWVNGGDIRPHYHVTVPIAARPAGGDGGLCVAAKPIGVYRPEGEAGIAAYSGRMLAVMIDRRAVEDALADALRRPITSQIDCQPVMVTTDPAVRSWLNMVSLFAEQLFEPGSPLQQPMVGMPYADSLVRGLLLAADHSYRAVLEAEPVDPPPPAVQTAIDVIEAEASQPLTVSALAERSYVSVRALQHGFRQHLDMTPMQYLREVRLSRAHQALLEADPARVTVASVAYRWGFTNLGRFAAAYSARYRQSPSETLRRNV